MSVQNLNSSRRASFDDLKNFCYLLIKEAGKENLTDIDSYLFIELNAKIVWKKCYLFN